MITAKEPLVCMCILSCLLRSKKGVAPFCSYTKRTSNLWVPALILYLYDTLPSISTKKMCWQPWMESQGVEKWGEVGVENTQGWTVQWGLRMLRKHRKPTNCCMGRRGEIRKRNKNGMESPKQGIIWLDGTLESIPYCTVQLQDWLASLNYLP